MILRSYENDKTIIPNEMDENLGKYDVGELLEGTFEYEVDKKDAKEITLCITSLSCKPQKRIKSNDEDGEEDEDY